jgi:hypothetical protein
MIAFQRTGSVITTRTMRTTFNGVIIRVVPTLTGWKASPIVTPLTRTVLVFTSESKVTSGMTLLAISERSLSVKNQKLVLRSSLKRRPAVLRMRSRELKTLYKVKNRLMSSAMEMPPGMKPRLNALNGEADLQLFTVRPNRRTSRS